MSDPQPNGGRALAGFARPALMLLGFIMLAAVGLIAVAFIVQPAEVGDISRILGEINGLSRMAALIIIVPAVVVLAMLDKLDGPVAGAILASIAGYVLGAVPPGH